MSTINAVKSASRFDSAHANWMGGPSWDLQDPVVRLRMAASSCFFGEPMYYHTTKSVDKVGALVARGGYMGGGHDRGLNDRELKHLRETLDALDPADWRGLSPSALMEKAIDEALDADIERTLAEASRLRNGDNIRTTPQVILVRAANHPNAKGTGLVRRYASEIIRRGDEPAVGLAYQLSTYGKPVPNSLKKAWKDALERLDDHRLAKYRMESRVVKTVDVVNVTHAFSPSIDKLVKGELKTTGETWEAIISQKGSNKEAWTEALDHMGHMALLRNIRNLLKAEVDPKLWLDKLIEGVPEGKQLPFRYYSAYKANESAPAAVRDALEECLIAAYAHSPHFSGRVMSLCDNSGSAWGTMTSDAGTMHIAEIANLTAVMTAQLSDEGHVGVFGDHLKTFDIRKRSSIFDQLELVRGAGKGIGAGTEHGIWLFWDQAIREKQHWDKVFVYSDMQAGHGGLYGTGGYSNYVWPHSSRYEKYIDVPKLVNEYRSKVNPDVQVFLVQVAGYRDTIIPEFYKNTYILGGWGDGILRFAAQMCGEGDPSPCQN